MGDTRETTEQRACHSADRCPHYNPVTQRGADTNNPLCDDCLTRAERDIRPLTYDYLDLAQLHEASLSQALNEHVAGSTESPLLIAGHVEALQAEIVHATTTWETEVRAAAKLSDPADTPTPVADWHTTISRPTPPAKVRAGAAVQRAVNVITPRIRLLSQLPPTAVCPTGVEDDPQDIPGWQAVHHLQELHRRARSLLGRTHRTIHLPGGCPPTEDHDPCDGQLFRDEPRYAEDPCPVYCGTCGQQLTQEQYEHYIGGLLAPTRTHRPAGSPA